MGFLELGKLHRADISELLKIRFLPACPTLFVQGRVIFSIFERFAASMRIFFLFLLMMFGLGSSALAQVDPYDAYLGKPPRNNDGRTSTRNKGDFRDRYMAEVGASFYILQDGLAQILLPGVNYNGRYVLFEQGDRFSGTLGSHGSIGFQVDPVFGSYFMLNLPLFFEANIGMGSQRLNESPVGFSFGVGPEFNLINRFNQFAAAFTASFRFQIRGRGYYIKYGESVGMPTGNVPFRTFAFGNTLF